MNTSPTFQVFQYRTLLCYRYLSISIGIPLAMWLLIHYGYFPENQSSRNLWNILLITPLLLIYAYAQTRLKQTLSLATHQLHIKRQIIMFSEIASYCTTVKESIQHSHSYLVRITLKNQQTLIFEMPGGSFLPLRKWFSSQGLRAKRTERDRKLAFYYKNEIYLRATVAVASMMLYIVVVSFVKHGTLVFKL